MLVSLPQGGPLDHTTNFPLRGGKHTFWEGGVRVVSFVSGPAVPAARRGSEYHGMLHSSDWLPTLVAGVAGGSVPPGGPTPVDGFDAWHAIETGGASPRNEVVHQVKNQYFNDSSTGYSLRVGDYKLIVGYPGDNRVVAWPAPGTTPTQFGKTGGNIEAGTNHCRAPTGGGKPSVKDKPCSDKPCLYNVVKDISESNNLADDPAYADTLASLQKRLAEVARTGPSTTLAYPLNKTAFKAASASICANAVRTDFLEPYDVTTLPPAPPRPPAPPTPPAPPNRCSVYGGIVDAKDEVCCLTSCGECSGKECGKRPGGHAGCCRNDIISAGVSCKSSGDAPCVLP